MGLLYQEIQIYVTVKEWGMSNTINNIPMYSTGLYMCVETPEGNVLTFDSSTPNNEIKNVINTIKIFQILQLQINFSPILLFQTFLIQQTKLLSTKILQIIQIV